MTSLQTCSICLFAILFTTWTVVLGRSPPRGWMRASEADINDCEPNPCKHDGVCKDFGKGFQCTCSQGWQGLRCRRAGVCEVVVVLGGPI